MTSAFNHELADDLKAIKGKLIAQQQRLFGHHENCVCDARHLCAFHADTHERLADAIRYIDLAIKGLRGV